MKQEALEKAERKREKSRERSEGVKITCTFHAKMILRNFPSFASSPLQRRICANAVLHKESFVEIISGSRN